MTTVIDLPCVMDGKDAYNQGYTTSMGVVLQGEPDIVGWSGPLLAWQELRVRVPNTGVRSLDYTMVAESSQGRTFGSCRLATVQFLSRRPGNKNKLVDDCHMGSYSHNDAVKSWEVRSQKDYNLRQSGMMVRITEEGMLDGDILKGVDPGDIKVSPFPCQYMMLVVRGKRSARPC